MTTTRAAWLAPNVRAEMARRGLSQTQVAAHLGTSQSGLSARLRGRVAWSANELIALSDMFGVPVDELLRPVAVAS